MTKLKTLTSLLAETVTGSSSTSNRTNSTWPPNPAMWMQRAPHCKNKDKEGQNAIQLDGGRGRAISQTHAKDNGKEGSG